MSLGNNNLSGISLPGDLKKLRRLDLQDNLLSDISPLKNLEHLIRLSLSKNKLTDISPLKELRNLKRLELQENPITELPAWITDFDMQIKWESMVIRMDLLLSLIIH